MDVECGRTDDGDSKGCGVGNGKLLNGYKGHHSSNGRTPSSGFTTVQYINGMKLPCTPYIYYKYMDTHLSFYRVDMVTSPRVTSPSHPMDEKENLL